MDWSLALRWPRRWRWARECLSVIRTWASVTRTWATIAVAVAIPAALARAPEQTHPPVRANQYTAQGTPEPYPRERRAPQAPQAPQEDWQNFTREPSYSREDLPDSGPNGGQNWAQNRARAPRAFNRDFDRGSERSDGERRPPPQGEDPAPWVPRQYDQEERRLYDQQIPRRPDEREPRAEPYREPPTPKRADLSGLGERLFFETRLSKSGETACASCHRPERAFSDIGRTSRADDGKAGRRNSPSLINSAGLPSFLWDGGARTLEHQALMPWKRGEMGITLEQAEQRLRSDPEYIDLFRTYLGQAPSASGMAAALAAFQRTLISSESRLERYLRGDARALSPIERDGHKLFEGRAGCGGCHAVQTTFNDGAPLQLSDFQFHNTGVGYQRAGKFADEGRYRVTKRREDLGAFRTPALRNLGRTAPYMHDGSIPTLHDVVEFYSRGGNPNPHQSRLIRPIYLASHEKEALVAFLRTMDDPVVTADCGQRPVWWQATHRPGGCGNPNGEPPGLARRRAM